MVFKIGSKRLFLPVEDSLEITNLTTSYKFHTRHIRKPMVFKIRSKRLFIPVADSLEITNLTTSYRFHTRHIRKPMVFKIWSKRLIPPVGDSFHVNGKSRTSLAFRRDARPWDSMNARTRKSFKAFSSTLHLLYTTNKHQKRSTTEKNML
jgi:hypothetical protein